MKQLTLLRHAKSSWADPNSRDHDRSLNEKGRHDAPSMGHRLKKLGCMPDQVFCSTAKRTIETAELLLPALGFPADDITPESKTFALVASIYEASAGQLFDVIATADPATNHLMLIGHNPGMELVCQMLVPKSVKQMKSGAASSYEIDTQNWQDICGSPSTLLLHEQP